MNLVAVGVLCLLALSMMVDSKRFRVLMGTAAFVGLVALVGRAYLGSNGTSQVGVDVQSPRFTWQFRVLRPDMEKTATEKSEQLLEESSQRTYVDKGELSGTGSETQNVQVLNFRKTGDRSDDRMQVMTSIAERIRVYLDFYRENNADPGVDMLQPLDLNWTLLKAIARGTDDYGVMHFSLVFDDAFHRHVRERGRQIIIKDHLKKAGYTTLGTLGILSTMFGILMLQQAKRKAALPGDYLASTGVSMV